MSNRPKIDLRGAVVLGRPAGNPVRIRNAWGKPIPCCWSECDQEADARYQWNEPHPEAKHPGERIVYAFCSPLCRDTWIGAHRGASAR